MPASHRLFAALIAAACLAVLIVAGSLAPSSDGHGTHEDLGMAPCGWLAASGTPCPSCGMTTSFAHAAHASPLEALKSHPTGAIFALFAAAVFWIAGHTALTGSRALSLSSRLLTTKSVTIVLIFWGASWGYKWLTWST